MNRPWRQSVAWLPGLVMVFGSLTADAHEFGVEPSTFTPGLAAPLGIRLCVADGFEGWSLARNPLRIEKFVAVGPSGEQAIVGLDGADPAGVARFTIPGAYLIAYRSNRAYAELPAAQFDAYLRDKGLEKFVAPGRKPATGGGKVREAYSRHAKALIRVGDVGRGVMDRVIGLGLELVAESDPPSAHAQDLQSFRLLYEGKPLAEALLSATRPGTADGDLTARTGIDGRASFDLRAAGVWRVAAVHMIKAPRNVDAQWESFWASLTFVWPSPASAGARNSGAAGKAACRNRIAAPLLRAAS